MLSSASLRDGFRNGESFFQLVFHHRHESQGPTHQIPSWRKDQQDPETGREKIFFIHGPRCSLGQSQGFWWEEQPQRVEIQVEKGISRDVLQQSQLLRVQGSSRSPTQLCRVDKTCLSSQATRSRSLATLSPHCSNSLRAVTCPSLPCRPGTTCFAGVGMGPL